MGAVAVVFTLAPIWIALGVAIGAALDWRKRKHLEGNTKNAKHAPNWASTASGARRLNAYFIQRLRAIKEDWIDEALAYLGKSTGGKVSADSDEADRIAFIRTLVGGVNFITCFFIMANTIRHW